MRCSWSQGRGLEMSRELVQNEYYLQFTKESSQIGYEADRSHTHTSFQLCCDAVIFIVKLLKFFPVTQWLKVIENVSHSKLIYIIVTKSHPWGCSGQRRCWPQPCLPSRHRRWLDPSTRDTKKRIRFFLQSICVKKSVVPIDILWKLGQSRPMAGKA